MAEVVLKSLEFPGLNNKYVIPTYTLSKNDEGDIVLTCSDGSTYVVADRVGTASDASAQMLINAEVTTPTYSTTNTLWRYAFVEIRGTGVNDSDVYCAVFPYHLTGAQQTPITNLTVKMVRSGSTTTWSLVNSASSDYQITRVRAYRIET